MFGYVRPFEPEMKICEFEYYRACYCGLCRVTGKMTGRFSRFFLNYDFVFLALVRIALAGEKPEFKYKRCAVHPVKKRMAMTQKGELDYCAAASALLLFHQCRDNVKDERGLSRLKARIALAAMRGMYRKAVRLLPDVDEKIRKRLETLAKLEDSRTESVDLPASCFGDLLADLFSYGFDGGAEKTARRIGFHIGKWVYVIDAVDDAKEDLKKGRYNPLNVFCKDQITKEEIDGILSCVKLELGDAELGFNMIEYGDDARLKGVIENILYIGMSEKALSVAKKARSANE